jgi:hypothetical protein
LGLPRSTLLAAAVFVAPAAASAHSAHVEWIASGACPGEAELRRAIERLLGEPLGESQDIAARAQVTLDEDGRFTLTLSLRTPEGSGTRSVRADTCEDALNVAAFGIALALNPELGAAKNPPEPAPTAPAPPLTAAAPAPAKVLVPEPTSEAPHEPTPERTERPSPPPELWLGANTLVDTSVLPSPAVGFGAAADVLLFGNIRLGLGGQYFLPQKHLLPTGEGGLFSWWSIDARACWQVKLSTPVAACPALYYGVMRGEGRGVTPSLTEESRFFAPGLRVLGLPSLSKRVSAVLGATALFPISRESFVVDAGTVHEIPAFSLELTAGAALRVP